jgi:hypothetical protein
MRRGAVHVEQAYAQGKMLNHADWSEVLPRRITPSDVDMAIDNDGAVILCELSTQCSNWKDIPKGQIKLYEALVKNTVHIAVLAYHRVPPDREINTRRDFQSIQVMLHSDGMVLSRIEAGYLFERLVKEWMRDAGSVRQKLFERVEWELRGHEWWHVYGDIPGFD